MSAKFIVLEGPDGSGTTKQTELLHKRIRQEQSCINTAEPTDGPIGRAIRTMLSAKEIVDPQTIQLMFCADRAQHVTKLIKPTLQSNTTIISDRYALSTIIYGAALGIDRAWLETINDAFIKPDITIIALPPFEVCQERLGRRDEQDQFEKRDFQKKVYDFYANIKDDKTVFVDTSGTKDATAEIIWNHIQAIL